jgi:hypothetical protein
MDHQLRPMFGAMKREVRESPLFNKREVQFGFIILPAD